MEGTAGNSDSQHHLDFIGKVKSIQCINFVTYRNFTFYPTECLNVIVAPNGTGKSTLIAALVLGLGGSPKILSRASSDREYIKNGEESATLRIELYCNKDGSKVTCFQRTFNISGKSTYDVDGVHMSKSQYVAKVASFKVNIGNLCQFLPQERVQDFARMNQHELLLNTLASVSNEKIVKDFERLKTLRASQLFNNDESAKFVMRQREVETRLIVLSNELRSTIQRQAYLKQIDLCSAKLAWIKTVQLKSSISEVNNDLTLAKKNAIKYEKLHGTFIKKQKALDESISKKQKDLTIKANAVSKIEQKIYANNAKTKELKDKIGKEISIYQSKQRGNKDYEGDIANAKLLLMGLEQDLQNAIAECGTGDERDAKFSSIEGELAKMKEEISIWIKKRRELNNRLDDECNVELNMYKNTLERLENVTAQKLHNLQTRYADVYNASQWVKKNKDIFKGVVYDPILLEVSVSEPIYAKYVEDAISSRDLLAFTCENKEDVRLLITELTLKRKLAVNVVFCAHTDSFDCTPSVELSEIKKYGFIGYLMDLLKGPPVILSYLSGLFHLHNIPYGTEEVDNHTDKMPRSIRNYYGGNQSYSLIISKYSGEPSLMQKHIKSKQLLFTSNDEEIQFTKSRITELYKQSDALRNERTSVEAKINEMEFQRSNIIAKGRKLKHWVEQANTAKHSINWQKQRLARLQEQITDLPQAMATLRDVITKYVKEVLDLVTKKVELVAELSRTNADKVLFNAKITASEYQNQRVRFDIEHALKDWNGAKLLVLEVETKFKNLKKKYDLEVRNAKKLTGNCLPEDDRYPEKAAYDALPGSIDQLNEVLIDAKGRLDCLQDVDPSVQHEHDQLSKEAVRLKSILEDNTKAALTVDSDIKAVYNQWYPTVESVVNTINGHFSRYFSAMGYVGEIRILSNEENNFDKFGLQICVQFRAGVPLQELDRYKQSGGERAVSIAVYTLSLQHVSHVPFRCVDEINQGMDSRNERKIFAMLLKETTQKGRSQYFFITPKLLSGLPFYQNMAVHIIFSGQHLHQSFGETSKIV